MYFAYSVIFLGFFCGDRVAHYFLCIFLPLCSVLWCPLRSSHNFFFGTSLPPVVCKGGSCLLYFICVYCVKWCPTHIVLCFCFVFLRLVYSMLTVSLEYLFWLPLRCSLAFTNGNIVHLMCIEFIYHHRT
jgi:hypothetical protein